MNDPMRPNNDLFSNLTHAAIVLVLGLPCAGCGESPPSDADECDASHQVTIERENMRVSLYGVEAEDVCVGGLQRADEHVRYIASLWQAEPAVFEYHLFDSDEHPCWSCLAVHAACAGPYGISAKEMPQMHELVHASHGPTCFPLLEEGFAVVYGPPFARSQVDALDLDAVLALEPGTAFPNSAYDVAAQFTAFLIDVHGVDVVVEVCENATASTPAINFVDVVSDVLNQPWDTVLDEFAAYPRCSVPQLRQDVACDADVPAQQAPVGQFATWDFSFDCSSGSTLGVRGDYLWVEHTVELEEGGIHEIEFVANRDVEVEYEIDECGPCGEMPYYHRSPPTALAAGVPHSHVNSLSMGRYTVRVLVRGDVPDDLMIAVRAGRII